MDFVKIEFFVILIFGGVLFNWQVSAKRVKLHIPFKVKHHHHVHTVVKHVHHQVPVHIDHEDVHVIHPDIHHDSHQPSLNFDYDDAWQSRNLQPQQNYDDVYSGYGDSQRERELEHANFGNILKKKRSSKKKNKILNNRAIGWTGRKDFDKIASEYLESLRTQRLPAPSSHEDEINYPTYTDDE